MLLVPIVEKLVVHSPVSLLVVTRVTAPDHLHSQEALGELHSGIMLVLMLTV